MRIDFKSLATELYSGKIDRDEFIRRYFEGDLPSDEYVMKLIDHASTKKNADLMEEAMVLLYTGYFNIKAFSLSICRLLKENWHMQHEDIAMLLKQIKIPETVDCLYDAAELQFDYLNYDDTYQFARKCIKAISEIGNDNAIFKLKLLTSSSVPEIAEYAKKELHYKGEL